MMRQRLVTIIAALSLAARLGAGEAEVLQDLKYGTPEKREAALEQVLMGQAPGAGPALLQILGESQGANRLKVIRGLGLVREDGAVKPLLELLSDPGSEFRLQAARSLGSIGDPAAAPGLVKALEDADVEVREAAARALGACGSPKDLDSLKPLLKDKNRLMRMAAIESIGRLGSAAALPVLQEQMQNADPAYKRIVVKAIGALKGTDIDASLKLWLSDKDDYLRGFTAEALALHAPTKSLEPGLIKLLSDPNIAVRIRAIEALGAWKSKAAVPAIAKALRAEEPTLRWKAAVALGAIGDASAKEALDYVAEHDTEVEVKKAAKQAAEGLK